MARKQNIKTINLIKSILKNVKLLIVVNIHGICSENMRYLRKKLNEQDQNIKVFKNQLSKCAMKNTPLQILSKNIKGEVALIWTPYNTPVLAQILKACEKKIPFSNIKCGFYNGKQVGTEYIKYLSEIPDMHILKTRILNILFTTYKKLLFNIKYQAITIINLLKIK